MKERREIVRLCRSSGADGGVLFSLVQVAGSSYRRPGARLIAVADGNSAGTISGGCLESDLLRRGLWTVRSGAVVEHFNTAFDDTAEIPYGLGCGGEVSLLAESLDTPEAGALLDAMEATLHGTLRIVATVLPHRNPLLRIVLDPATDVLFASEALSTPEIVDVRLAALRAEHGSIVEQAGSRIFVERLEPAQRLVIFGAGEDARPLARIACELGWSVVVADPREQRLRSDRFPGTELMQISSAAEIPVETGDAVVLMTHSYEQDRSLLAELLPLSPSYLGLLGARHRSALLLQEAALGAGISFQTAVERTHAPIGLQLGGDGPEAVALSIVAELQQYLYQNADRQAKTRRMSAAEAEQLLANGPDAIMKRETCKTYLDIDSAVASEPALKVTVTL